MKGKTMNKKTAISLVAVGMIGVAAVYTRSIANDLHDRFPHLSKKVLMRAYASMMRKSMAGHYPDIDDMTDDEMDVIFLAEVAAIK